MEELNRQVNRARRWLGLQRFARALGWCCFGTLLIALAFVIADKYRPMGIEPWVYLVVALVTGGLLAALIAYVRGRGSIDAAIEIDRRFGLKERVSSTLALTPEEQLTDIGQALIADAEQRVKKIDVNEHFHLAPGRQLLLPLIPLVAAVLVVWLVSPAVVEEDPQVNAAAIKKQVKLASEGLKSKLIEKRKAAEKAGLKDAKALLDRLEEEAGELSREGETRKEALVKLNDLKRQMENRQKQIGGAEEIRKKLDQLNTGNRGPAENFMKSISDGDLKKAVEALEKLKKDLIDDKLSEEEKEQLQKQLNEMKEKLEEAVQKHEQQCKNLQNQINQAQQAGQTDEAQRLQDQLNQLMERNTDMQQLQDMANQLGQCSQCMQDGDMQNAADMLDQMQSDLSDLQQQLDEMQLLDDAMDQLCEARDQMNCPQCGGQGCAACQGNQPMMGMGEGQGRGDRPEDETAVKFYDDKVKQKIGRGRATIAGEADGPNIKGQVYAEIADQLEVAKSESTDPLTEQQMPRQHQEQTKEYFNMFRTGESPE